MITRIQGKLTRLEGEAAYLESGDFEYEVLVPEYTRRQLQHQTDRTVRLFTIQFFEGQANQGRLTPRLVGFSSEVEREFFELLCSVDGMGMKKALRAMGRPVKEIAVAIEQQDVKAVSSLPGIGPATAERIIAKLRRKMPKFALMVTRDEVVAEVTPDIVEETFAFLVKIGHPEAEARRLLNTALAEKKSYPDFESLIHAIYQKQKTA